MVVSLEKMEMCQIPLPRRDLLPQMPTDSLHLSALSWFATVSMGFLQDMLFLLPTPTPSLSKDWLSRYKHPSIFFFFFSQDRPTLKYILQSSPDQSVIELPRPCCFSCPALLANSLSVPASRKSNLRIWPYLLSLSNKWSVHPPYFIV